MQSVPGLPSDEKAWGRGYRLICQTCMKAVSRIKQHVIALKPFIVNNLVAKLQICPLAHVTHGVSQLYSL